MRPIIIDSHFGVYIVAFSKLSRHTPTMDHCCCLQMWGLYRDPEGKHVFEGPTTTSSSGPASSGGSGSRQQVAALQTRIRELERQVQEGADSAHNGVSTTSTLNSVSGILYHRYYNYVVKLCTVELLLGIIIMLYCTKPPNNKAPKCTLFSRVKGRKGSTAPSEHRDGKLTSESSFRIVESGRNQKRGYNKPVKVPFSLVHYGKYSTRGVVSGNGCASCFIGSRPHPRAILP